MLTLTTAYRRQLNGGLVLKSIDDERDAERLAVYNGSIFGNGVTEFSRSVMFHHPASRPEYWLYVEDETSGEIVSSLCLIPWQWRYEDVTLKSGEMGIVSTLESYRNRGLIREQVSRFKELLRDDGFDLSHIQGIPYYYRQFGYEYAIPLEPGWELELRNISDTLAEQAAPYHYRRATIEDVPVLMGMYDDTTRPLQVSTVRSADVWDFVVESGRGEIEGETWLMLDGEDRPVGYWRIALHGFGEGLIVSETSRLSAGPAEALLRHLKTLAMARNKPYIRLNLPESNDLLRTARWHGAHDSGTYAWQIHLVNVGRLLCKLTPVLERRIADSPFAGLTQKVSLNLYKEAFELDFQRGKLRDVNELGFCDRGEINIPPLLLAPLLLGYRSREELKAMYPDVNIWGQGKALIDVLFPKLESFIYTNY